MSDHCQNCESDRIAHVNGKTVDACYIEVGSEEYEGNVPTDMGVGGGDYLRFAYCLECGQIQGEFPLDETDIETGSDPDDDYESDDGEWHVGEESDDE